MRRVECVFVVSFACSRFLSRAGTIDIDEFFKAIHERHTAFGDAIFDLIDCDDSGVLDFSEFVTACGTFCMFGNIFKIKNGLEDAEEEM